MIWINLKKELAKKGTFTKNTWYDWYDWLINYILEPIKRLWVGLKSTLRVFLKTRIMVNLKVSKLCMEVEINNQKKT